MKTIKLILTSLLVTFLTMLSGKAFADTASYTITVEGATAGHTYEAYQIFKGDLFDSTLSNITWGSGVTQFTFNNSTDAAKIAEGLKEANAAAFAKEAGKHLTATIAGTGTHAITVNEAGYYLIKDKNDSQTGKHDAYTSFVLKVVKNTSFKPKSAIPTVLKKVKDRNDKTGLETGWQDSADYDKNDKVPFQLTATLPSNYDAFQEYYLEFVDTLSKGLSYNKDAKVYVVNGDTRQDITNSFTVSEDGSSFKIDNLKAVQGVTITATSKIVVEYTATLNDQAAIGKKGNPNEVALTYSNDPNALGKGEESPKGETPKDKVIVFTYKTIINKVDQDQKALKGAGFTLYKLVKGDNGEEKYQIVQEIKAGDTTSFEFVGLDAGDYKLSETTTPGGYNTIADVMFSIVAQHETESDDPQLTSLTVDKATGFTADTEAGTVSATIVNKKGSILPSTGSIGTTMLYVFGVMLMTISTLFIFRQKQQ
ncbi:TPA: isopeptide-forming domain-containing fimbrial protein [Streptococcus equi subsp. zooepidemicus]|uniref:Putative backbone pilus subunit (T6-antigen-like) n=1 Tax=Streptococcus equi subsp. zooepidemicus (strain H70) TaxID=553483 RepID=C0MH04_STRS7|nr:isopeptide-forming domain-containing fimbrial protein [Streptococcus equi]MCD3466096.1 isopeptide-forming domain-containing fimbrial protein [Streptococcus equi subsp. zooepidemicus]MDI5915528.1 isopeptide-forming domain-containing fimbrial protein [Streptococcus equi subsp. zooepidemicus]CAW99580.1 putative backbone pilus subunit (T6-antigen-like) [Streptococcus equi subsp. zooepidemicus]HEL0198560.1 isopeptide-forming domain-containing fimbrial protein [Streptococcus equi subsp. zooepidemi